MSRTFVPVSVDWLKLKIESALRESDLDLRELTPKVEADLNKVAFSMENWNTDQSRSLLTGYQMLNNGLVFLGVRAGGDWEQPLLFIIYWDGKQLRGYIPKEGNTWNTQTKEAYGNNEEADLKNVKKRRPDWFSDPEQRAGDFADLFDADAIIADIEARIKRK